MDNFLDTVGRMAVNGALGWGLAAVLVVLMICFPFAVRRGENVWAAIYIPLFSFFLVLFFCIGVFTVARSREADETAYKKVASFVWLDPAEQRSAERAFLSGDRMTWWQYRGFLFRISHQGKLGGDFKESARAKSPAMLKVERYR